MMTLQQYDFDIIHRPGKTNTNADTLSQINETPYFMLGTKEANNEIEWITSSNDQSTINITEDNLIEWYFTREICDNCGIPSSDLIKQENNWKFPCLYQVCDRYFSRLQQFIFETNSNIDQIE